MSRLALLLEGCHTGTCHFPLRLVLFYNNRGGCLFLQQSTVPMIILFQLVGTILCLGNRGIIYRSRIGYRIQRMSYHLTSATRIHQGGLCLFQLDAIFIIFQNKQRISFAHMLMLGKANPLDVARYPDIDGRQVLLYLRIIGCFARPILYKKGNDSPQS